MRYVESNTVKSKEFVFWLVLGGRVVKRTDLGARVSGFYLTVLVGYKICMLNDSTSPVKIHTAYPHYLQICCLRMFLLAKMHL